jgi:hypothetical protein
MGLGKFIQLQTPENLDVVNTIHDEIVIANCDALTCKNFQVYYTNIEIEIVVQQLELHDADATLL